MSSQAFELPSLFFAVFASRNAPPKEPQAKPSPETETEAVLEKKVLSGSRGGKRSSMRPETSEARRAAGKKRSTAKATGPSPQVPSSLSVPEELDGAKDEDTELVK